MNAPILLTGCNGQLGFELQTALTALGLPILALNHQTCDLSDHAALRRLLAEHRPSIIVNAAAYTAVDRAETEPELANAVNALAPGILGEAAAAIGALVVHYSTDYVFDGQSAEPYRESDAPNPLNVYGHSKLAGERALQASGAKHLIFRTSWVFGAHGNNFAKTMLRLAAERETLNVVADQYGAPTSAALLAEVTAQILREYLSSETFPFGLYHLTASGATNWHAYAAHVIAAARDFYGNARPSLKLAADGLNAITASAYPLPAARPANSRLDCSLLQRRFGLRLPPWQEGVDRVLQQIL
ncbi:NAD(P)-dependent oxidoreductase [Betaproteobacteria bacterium]|nr:NAD(P)-dependent oxidoreductase [Betaproteobacteria bacterium]GHU39797.1 NAD(P)-dependent oxidoreductase [Betaproteobacteria bacterium]